MIITIVGDMEEEEKAEAQEVEVEEEVEGDLMVKTQEERMKEIIRRKIDRR